jgi:hypothetical protein
MRKLTAIAMALGLTCAGVWLPCARAATIDTYDFTQGGYTFNGSPFLTGVLTGSFTGNVESSGFIEIADLVQHKCDFYYHDCFGRRYSVFRLWPRDLLLL